jgi:small-conductance mechanosensitive channel
LSGFLLSAIDGVAGQPAPGGGLSLSPQDGDVAQDVKREADQVAPVLLGGEPVVWILARVGPWTTEERAERARQRLETIVHDRTVQDPHVTVLDVQGSAELRIAQRLLMVVTRKDAEAAGLAARLVANEYAGRIEAAIRAERLRYAPATLLRSAGYAAAATLALVAGLWLVRGISRWLRRQVVGWRSSRLRPLRVQQIEIISTERLSHALEALLTLVRVLLVLAVLDAYLTYVLGLFPWTRAASFQLYDYVITPIQTLVSAFAGYLPNLLFVVVITVVIYAAMRTVGFFFAQVREGRIVFAQFPAEWADPTNTIARVLLVALGAVVAFPYLPASGSPAFAGVSVLLGVVLSLASSSSLSNTIAGLVLTYAGAFRLGDRVKIGDAVGDIVEQSLLATHIRTIKNEEITIPNGIVLGSPVTNYSRQAKTRGLILHTSVTIGYDAPWRTVHDLLLQAAAGTPGVLADPSPFVWQTALNDFYVTYEINAYTDTPRAMFDIYAALHRNIQDAFYAAGVEIMSPHFTALRDGNTVAIPEAFRPRDYLAPRFRVDGTARSTVE